MQSEFTKEQAWNDFYVWIRKQDTWKAMSRAEKIKTGIYEANAANNGLRDHALGWERLRRILTTYAPGRYEFREVVILKDGK